MIGMPGAPPEKTFVGGVWSARINAIWPLARLELFDFGIRLRGSVRGVRWLVPAWEARYADLTAQLVAVPVASHGVLLATVGDYEQIVFWTRRGTEILDRLQMHGVPVDRSVARLEWGGNIHHPLPAGFDRGQWVTAFRRTAVRLVSRNASAYDDFAVIRADASRRHAARRRRHTAPRRQKGPDR